MVENCLAGFNSSIFAYGQVLHFLTAGWWNYIACVVLCCHYLWDLLIHLYLMVTHCHGKWVWWMPCLRWSYQFHLLLLVTLLWEVGFLKFEIITCVAIFNYSCWSHCHGNCGDKSLSYSCFFWFSPILAGYTCHGKWIWWIYIIIMSFIFTYSCWWCCQGEVVWWMFEIIMLLSLLKTSC